MLSMLGKSFNRQHFEIFFLISPRKQALTFFANCLLKTTRPFFLGKIIKNHQFGKIWQSAEFAHRAVKVTKMSATGLLPKQTKYLFNQKLNYVQYHINVLCWHIMFHKRCKVQQISIRQVYGVKKVRRQYVGTSDLLLETMSEDNM